MSQSYFLYKQSKIDTSIMNTFEYFDANRICLVVGLNPVVTVCHALTPSMTRLILNRLQMGNIGT